MRNMPLFRSELLGGRTLLHTAFRPGSLHPRRIFHQFKGWVFPRRIMQPQRTRQYVMHHLLHHYPQILNTPINAHHQTPTVILLTHNYQVHEDLLKYYQYSIRSRSISVFFSKMYLRKRKSQSCWLDQSAAHLSTQNILISFHSSF